VEAALHSGSLSTARHAMQQNREVFGIPGSIHSPLSRGCHALIRQGAKLVETAEHILEEVGALIDYAEPKVKEAPVAVVSETDRETLDPAYQKLLDVIDFSPQPVDKLIERSGLRPEEVASMLLILELDGHITAAGGGKYVRAS
jgi:Predicted Rossmann fold nucleotide-binding protein involved in DNA uptake